MIITDIIQTLCNIGIFITDNSGVKIYRIRTISVQPNLQNSITEKDDVLNTIKDRLKNQEKPIDILKDINDGAAYDLTGCTTEEILYIINQGRPVIAMLDSQNAVILVGYSDTNVVYEDLNDSTRHSVKYEEMDQMTSGSGNAYIG